MSNSLECLQNIDFSSKHQLNETSRERFIFTIFRVLNASFHYRKEIIKQFNEMRTAMEQLVTLLNFENSRFHGFKLRIFTGKKKNSGY